MWCACIATMLGLASGCMSEREHPRKTEGAGPTPSAIVDEALLAWLSRARSLHHMADLAEDSGDIDRAISLLNQLFEGPAPQGHYVEKDEIMADTRARLAELRSRQGDQRGALHEVEQGLALTPDRTYFRGHLLEVRGVVAGRLAKALEAEGRHEESVKMRSQAVAASLEAVKVQEEVIQKTLDDSGTPSSRNQGVGTSTGGSTR
jgi:tetratricopeptide (TPR) repeat protein